MQTGHGTETVVNARAGQLTHLTALDAQMVRDALESSDGDYCPPKRYIVLTSDESSQVRLAGDLLSKVDPNADEKVFDNLLILRNVFELLVNPLERIGETAKLAVVPWRQMSAALNEEILDVEKVYSSWIVARDKFRNCFKPEFAKRVGIDLAKTDESLTKSSKGSERPFAAYLLR